MNSLFSNVPQKDYLELFDSGKARGEKVVDFLKFNKREIAEASNVPMSSVRFDQKMPKELEERLTEWATAIALVGQHFQDAPKTVLWFKIPNPLLGNVAPRDMIRVGRFKKLLKFIQTALDENRSEPNAA